MSNVADINTFHSLHTEAMDLAEEAFKLKRSLKISDAKDKFEKALSKEKQAFLFIQKDYDCEPTRSVISRSIASLALNCDQYREAEKYVCIGLTGNPPHDIAEELRDLLQQVNFERHLHLKGLTPLANELQLSFSGNAVGHGMILSEDKNRQIQSLERMFNRTSNRLNNEPFKKDKNGGYRILESASRAQSFAVTLRLVSSHEASELQTKLPYDQSVQIIDETLNCLELVNNNQQEELKHRIPNPDYYTNFLSLAKEIAPDGKNLSLVGFTSFKNGQERKVEFKRLRSNISMHTQEEVGTITPKISTNNELGSEKIFTGIMKEANVTKRGKSELEAFKLEDSDTGKDSELIFIPDSMNDIVQNYWKANVKVQAICQVITKTGKKGSWLLQDIDHIEK